MSKHGWTTLLLLCKAEKLISCLVTPDAQASKQENTIYFVLSCLTRTLVDILFSSMLRIVSLPSSGNISKEIVLDKCTVANIIKKCLS